MVDKLRPDDPTEIGGWELIGRLGSGGMGHVWLAQDPTTGTPIALKTLRTDLSGHVSLRRFRREVEATLRVSSPWTAQVLAVGLDDDPPYLVTEYVSGPTLEQKITHDGPLDTDAAIAFAAAFADGLAAIHRAGVVHRDLSIRNVILSPRGPKIIDLGIARVSDATRLTSTGLSLGTPSSMSPEQIRGEGVGPASDVFSWGLAAAYSATGRLAFGTGRPEAVAYRIVHDEPDLDGLRRPLATVVAAALQKRPEDRPTAAELRNDLAQTDRNSDATVAITQLVRTALLETAPARQTVNAEALRHDQQRTRPVDDEEVPASRAGRTRSWPTAAAAVLVLLVAIAGGMWALNRDDPPTGVSAGPQASPSQPPPTEESDEAVAIDDGASGSARPTPTPAMPDAMTADLTSGLPSFHDELVRFPVDRPDTPAAVVSLSAPRQDEPRPVTVTLFEWDRGDYAVADEREINCGFLSNEPEWDDGVFYLDCAGGASAAYLYAIDPQPLELEVHPFGDDDYGWLHSGWERRSATDAPDTLVIYQQDCDPNCAEGKLTSTTLMWDATFEWWNAVECTTPDGRTLEESGWNASARPHLELSACQ